MNRLIVSLTSYGARLGTTCSKAIKSLNSCLDYKPDLIVLYVAEGDRDLVKNQFKNFKNLSIRYCPDYRSHKKFMACTEKEFISDYIVIADDDLSYKTYFFQKLFDKFHEHEKEGKFIVCNRGQRIVDMDYKHLKYLHEGDYDSGNLIFGSGSGVLIPPNVMRFDEDFVKKGCEVSPNCDENWYACYCIKNNIKEFCTCKPQPFYQIPLPKEDPAGLWTKYNQFEKETTFHRILEYFGLEISDKIFVSFTSWRARINYAAKVVERMRRQTLKPEKIILTLSTDEFPEKEKELPENLVNMVDDIFEIRWVKENTKTFKKLEPLFYIHPEHLVLIIDDDVPYDKDFIQTMYYSIKGDEPVTGSSLKTWYHQYKNVVSANGAFCLIKPKHCLPYLKDMVDYLLQFTTELDSDPILTYCVLMNGLKFDVSKVDYRKLQAKYNNLPQPYSGGKEGQMRNQRIHELIQNYLKEMKK